jgi:hypothetical protein
MYVLGLLYPWLSEHCWLWVGWSGAPGNHCAGVAWSAAWSALSI